MRYEGPIYRPPSEADSLLIQATVGCPHNQCTFCMVYKKGIRFKIRPTTEILADLDEASRVYGPTVRTLFLPAGNTIAMPTEPLATICRSSYALFPHLRRITVYGSAQFICQKGPKQLRTLAAAGLTRIHVGLESGDDVVLSRVHKGATAAQQITAGRLIREAGLELSEYVVLGLGGQDRSTEHVIATAGAINAIQPDFLRLRTLVPKVDTPLLTEIQSGQFQMLTPHGVIRETLHLIDRITAPTQVVSDHYTNYVNIAGRLPEDKPWLLEILNQALQQDESSFRPFFIGTQ
jgi:radical SAM superfamily enzyme YgiQ (UPF0313 family)